MNTPGVRVLSQIDLRGGRACARWTALCGRSAGLSGEADAFARAMIERVRAGGDAALFDATRELEGRTLDATSLEIPRDAWLRAREGLAREVVDALELAAARIRAFHETQRPSDSGVVEEGARLRSRVRPLARVAVYAPGGTAAYPSSVLMAAIPARVAGVAEVILLTPRPAPAVLAAAAIAGVDRVLAIGGAQAIVAAALGTESVPRVDKIVGPGNAWVTAAKRAVYGWVDVDSIAGPSEILIVADASADATIVAADLLSQAEHDAQACAIVISDDVALLDAVDAALIAQLGDLPRRDIASRALADHGAAVLVDDRAAMRAAADAFAPEHLELLVQAPAALADEIQNAGAIFVGAWTPEAAGDYTAGPSHVLPTAGGARFGSPLGVWDFVKYTSVLELDENALRRQAGAIVTLARAEGLEAHARAVELRMRSEPSSISRARTGTTSRRGAGEGRPP